MKNLEKLIWNTYEELFKAATPPADFSELVKNATINEEGKKEIPFMNYEIGREEYDEIVNKSIKEGKLDKINAMRFRTTIALGCSPKTK